MSLVARLADLQTQLRTLEVGADLVDQIEDYLIPRLYSLDAPLLAVIGGSTGAGKSTLTNSLIGESVSAAGVLRPTTRTPLLLCNPADQDWFTTGGVLAQLPRSTGDRGVGVGLHMVPVQTLPPGLGIIDAPDVDSFEVANHELAAQLLSAADLWIFTTTAARYGDYVPWSVLDQAAQRGVAIAVVINRIPPGEAQEIVVSDLGRLLEDHGLGHVPIFPIQEGALSDGRLTEEVAGLKRWLWGLAASDDARRQTILQTLKGALDSLPARVDGVASGLDQLAHTREQLEDLATKEYAGAADRIMDQAARGVALKTEVVDRFVEHVGTAGWMDKLQRSAGRWRDRVMGLFTKADTPEELAAQEIEGGLSLIITQALLDAHDRIDVAWAMVPQAPPVPACNRETLTSQVEQMVADWRGDLLALVRKEAEGKVGVARGLSIGINAAGVALMLAVFSATGGITGGEVAVAGGTAAVGQAMLSAIFGDQAVRTLVKQASEDLRTRVHAIAVAQQLDILCALDPLPTREEGATLRGVAEAVANEARRVFPQQGA